MNILIIYAHPPGEGHCYALLDILTMELTKRKQKYEVLNLYKMNFDPVLKANELITDKKASKLSKDIKAIQYKMKESKLIFIYPTWWNNMPAILKGFVDRVFTNNFAYTFKNDRPQGLLKGHKAAVFCTRGAPLFIADLIGGARATKVLINDTLKFCGFSAKAFRIGNAMQEMNPKIIHKIKKTVEKGLDWLL